MHIVLGYQRPLALLDPGKLDLLMPVQMGIEMGEFVLLDDHRLVMRHRNGKLKDLHHYTILTLMAARARDQVLMT